jgi:exopolysaccharide biosynthesis polyprenyl glycosylphosphotransferase
MYKHFFKRLIDLVLSTIGIIVLSIPMLIVALIIKIDDPGPVFFKQKRVGRMGKCFTMLKFRSMRVNADSNKAWTTGTDPRKTKFGTFLRRTAIDELPQLFNVLVGSMSLVGPRPEIPVFVEHFKEIVPLYMIKHYVKPGITGLAQIKGFRGDTSIEARIHEDIAYIENWSLALDLYVLFKTPFKAINKNEKFVSSGQSEEPSDEEKLEASLKKDTEAQNKDTAAQNDEKEETNE